MPSSQIEKSTPGGCFQGTAFDAAICGESGAEGSGLIAAGGTLGGTSAGITSDPETAELLALWSAMGDGGRADLLRVARGLAAVGTTSRPIDRGDNGNSRSAELV
ncbi:hypothetical protein [Crateriforma conspicua]|uniref:Uncharacterized protein n=1 Tax=Crateriforma conspicua TaxID=2527996 RepID=A0A5C6FT30_9PLAN|nr:hypothetical protein [Crateriforma conspicua]TWU64630.1 hypothetical protein V7x_01740 [Crateriforma conspicua]